MPPLGVKKQNPPDFQMHVSGLFLYPVKSLHGFSVSRAEVDQLGLIGDRRFLLVDETGGFLTQRQLPRMALISTQLTATELILSIGSGDAIHIPLRDSAPTLRTVSIWRSRDLLAEDCGEDVAIWLSAFLNAPCRLVRIGEKFRRPVLQKPRRGLTPPITAATPTIEGRIVTDDLFHFADGYPLLAISEASLDQLNDRLISAGKEPVPMDRFRPNIVIRDARAHAEDTWPRVRIGELLLRAGGPCARCIVTTTDQLSGERGKEPLRTLATYRRDEDDPTNLNFGQNLVHETKSGVIQVGDTVEPL